MTKYKHVQPVDLKNLGYAQSGDERIIWVVSTPKQLFTHYLGHQVEAVIHFDPDEKEWYLIDAALATASKCYNAILYHCVNGEGDDFSCRFANPNRGKTTVGALP